MTQHKEVSQEQKEELYIWKPNGGFHHKYIYDWKNNIWLELTEEECLQKMKKAEDKYKESKQN